jgi:hypothetical protein
MIGAALACAGMCVAASPARGAAVVYEGFGYAAGSDALNQNGGVGFAGAWAGRRALLGSGSALPAGAASTVLATSLSYSDGANQLATTGGSLFITGQNGNLSLARTVDQSLLPSTAVGETSYISFLGRRSGASADPNDPIYSGAYPWGSNLYPRNAGVNLYGDDGGDAIDLTVGNASNVVDSDVWRLRGQDLDGASKDPKSTVPFGAGNATALFVMRIDYGIGDGGAPRLNFWVNPVLSSEGANVAPVFGDWEDSDDPLPMQPGWIGLSAGDGSSNRPFAEFTLDEFRVGATWEDVTPFVAVPEPATWALVAGWAVALAGAKRRRMT